MLKTPEQYVESLRDGRVERAAGEFWIAQQPKHKDLFAMVEDGEEIAFSFKVPQTGEDIQRRRLITQTLNHNAIGGARLTGIDSLKSGFLAQ